MGFGGVAHGKTSEVGRCADAHRARSALNTTPFVVFSIKPDVKKSFFSPFGMASGFSFTLTTAGYGWASLVVGGFL